jgi:hypothetical protein
VVDVTHDRHDRRADDEVGVVAVVGAEGEVEAVEQGRVLLLRRDDLDVVAEVGAEQLQRLVGAGLRRRSPSRSSSVKTTCTSEPGLALMRSAKSASDAPRGRRTDSPLPRATPPPIVGAARLSNS